MNDGFPMIGHERYCWSLAVRQSHDEPGLISCFDGCQLVSPQVIQTVPSFYTLTRVLLHTIKSVSSAKESSIVKKYFPQRHIVASLGCEPQV